MLDALQRERKTFGVSSSLSGSIFAFSSFSLSLSHMMCLFLLFPLSLSLSHTHAHTQPLSQLVVTRIQDFRGKKKQADPILTALRSGYSRFLLLVMFENSHSWKLNLLLNNKHDRKVTQEIHCSINCNSI